MAIVCYHASHEQFAPSHLLQLVQLAEKAGFQGIHSSDHFHPWSERQGQSGFTLSWIGAAMQAVNLPFSMVCAPGQRLHPAIVAQAIATLSEMFPGRFNIELGSGEAINESITGDRWPEKEQRNERLMECYHIIKKMLAGEEVSFNGHVDVKEARLYTLPVSQPLLFCAAISEKTAAWAGDWADGLLTTAGSLTDVRKKINAFRNNGGLDKPVYLQFAFSYARNMQDALEGAFDQWRSNIQPLEQLANFSRVAQFDEAAQTTTLEDVRISIPIYGDIHSLKEKVQKYCASGIDRLILHNVNRQQEDFLTDFAQTA